MEFLARRAKVDHLQCQDNTLLFFFALSAPPRVQWSNLQNRKRDKHECGNRTGVGWNADACADRDLQIAFGHHLVLLVSADSWNAGDPMGLESDGVGL
jgi:hypothetical protein